MASIFTRIMRHELPAHIVYEDAHAVAFLDINPKSEGHTLVVPREEVATFHELSPEAAAQLAVALRRVAGAVSRAVGTPHYNLTLNNGTAAGQVVFHVHFHILPRQPGQHLSRTPLNLPSARMEAIAAAIRAEAEGEATSG